MDEVISLGFGSPGCDNLGVRLSFPTCFWALSNTLSTSHHILVFQEQEEMIELDVHLCDGGTQQARQEKN